MTTQSEPQKTLFPNELQTKKEVAKVFRVTTRSLESWMKSGELKFIRPGKKALLFNPTYLNEKFGG